MQVVWPFRWWREGSGDVSVVLTNRRLWSGGDGGNGDGENNGDGERS